MRQKWYWQGSIVVTAKTVSMRVTAGRMLMVYLACLAAAKLGLLIPYIGTHVARIWLSSGIAIAAILRWGFINATPIYPASFTANFSTGVPLVLAAQRSIGNSVGSRVSSIIIAAASVSVCFVVIRTVSSNCSRTATAMCQAKASGRKMLKFYGPHARSAGKKD